MRNLSDILSPLGINAPGVMVNDLRIDSRAVQNGDVFVALVGHTLNGEDFAHSALSKGAQCIIVDATSNIEIESNKLILVNELNKNIARISAAFYQHPSERVSLIGVTGTNGKSTTTAIIAELASKTKTNAAVIGTLGYGHTRQLIPLANTTPTHVDLQRILDELSKNNHLVAMEVSSHGLAQGRVSQCLFDIAVFTNLSRDHLDYHGDMHSYAQTKLQLFTEYNTQFNVINIDDNIATQWINKGQLNNLVAYGQWQNEQHTQSFEKYLFFNNVHYDKNGVTAQLKSSWGEAEIQCPLYGLFNLYNLCAAITTLLLKGFSLHELVKGAASLLPVDGRMQAFSHWNYPTCVVDYAHTPEALEVALNALKQHVPSNITCVFGCGGDRDKGKRPLMAKAAEQYADHIVVTSDNPRSEMPEQIIGDIKAGFSSNCPVTCIENRGDAIRYAIQNTDPQGIVLIAGKGHENYQIIGNRRIDFCDKKVIKNFFEGVNS